MKIKLLLLLVLTFVGCSKKAEKENVKFKTEKVATEDLQNENTFSQDCDLDNFFKK